MLPQMAHKRFTNNPEKRFSRKPNFRIKHEYNFIEFLHYNIFWILQNIFFISESSNGEIPTISTLSSKSGSFLTVASPRSSQHLLWKDNIVVFVEHTTETSTMNGPRKTEKPWLTVQPQWSKNTSGINFCFDKWTYCCFLFL